MPISFDVPAANVFPVPTPTEYYRTLLNGVQTASRRIGMTFFYTTTDAREQNFIQAVAQRCLDTYVQQGKQVNVEIIVDYNRTLDKKAPTTWKASDDIEAADAVTESHAELPAKRNYSSSAALLMEILVHAPEPDNIHIGLLDMPANRGSALRKLLPSHIGKGMAQTRSVSHMKFHVFDNDVVITGANVSKSYFSVRQDRYILIRDCAALADYLFDFMTRLNRMTGMHQLLADGTVGTVTPMGMPIASSIRPGPVSGDAMLVRLDASAIPPIISRASSHYNSEFNRKFVNLLHEMSDDYGSTVKERDAGLEALGMENIATIRPRFQLGSAHVNYDFDATYRLVQSLGPALGCGSTDLAANPAERAVGPLEYHTDVCHLATGYLNLAKPFYSTLVTDVNSESSIHVLTASPETMDFNESCGCFSGSVRNSYSEISRRFYTHVVEKGRLQKQPNAERCCPGIALYEYARKDWTFHGKGIWVHRKFTDVREMLITCVGSSNFGRRSARCDVEFQAEITTMSPLLCKRLLNERRSLFAESIEQHHKLVAKMNLDLYDSSDLSPAEQPGTSGTQTQAVGDNTEAGVVWRKPGRRLTCSCGPRGFWVRPASKVLQRWL